MVSIKDIANACGVSAATVSKALHDQKDVGKATKEKIKRTASGFKGTASNDAVLILLVNKNRN